MINNWILSLYITVRLSGFLIISIQRSKSRHSDYGHKPGRENSVGVYGGGGGGGGSNNGNQSDNSQTTVTCLTLPSDYYSASLTGGGSSLSSTLDEMMLDMSTSSTIVECYCGQNSCPQCNLLLKMAGDDGQMGCRYDMQRCRAVY